MYKRLIKQVAKYENISIIDALIKVYNSFISTKIDDYNSSVYYENPSYIFELNITVRQSRQSGVARATCPD